MDDSDRTEFALPPREEQILNENSELSQVTQETNSENRTMISPESGIVLEGGTTDMTEGGEKTLSPEATAPSPNQLYSFDLTNPDEIIKMLETTELTDDETDALLYEAYNVNAKLKEILRRQQKSGGEYDPSVETVKKGSKVVVVPESASKSPNSRGASAGSRDGFTQKAPLPPIGEGVKKNPSAGIYSAKLRRPAPPPSATSGRIASSSHAGFRTNPKPPSGKRKGSGRKRQPVSINERPQWDDRFGI